MCLLFPKQSTRLVPNPCVRAAEDKLPLEKGTALARLIATASPQRQPWSVGLLWKLYRPNNNEWKGISKWFLSYWLLSCNDENFYNQFNWLFLLLHIMIMSSKVKGFQPECSSRARWPLAPKFCPWATTKSQIFHTNHMLGTLDFTVSEHWAPFNFPQSTALQPG